MSTPVIKPTDSSSQPVVGYVHTAGLPSLLQSLGISLLVSTYQAQRILALAPKGEKLTMLMRSFKRPTGIAYSNGKLALCSKNQLWILEDAGELRDEKGVAQPFDLVLTPRRSFVTGDVLGHEVGWHEQRPIFVNTRFSCLATPDDHFSFLPVWKPKFISALAPQDRCHLNGLIIDEQGPLYVSALSESDTAEGWRSTRMTGGVLIDVRSNEVVSRGMCMPHSPRLYEGKLWILESGIGELQVVDQRDGTRTTVVKLPGYLRGLCFHDQYAFVGLCKIREKYNFGGVPVEALHPNLECAIYVLNIQSGEVAGFINFTKGIEELFDLIVLPGATNPHIIGFEEDTIDGLYVLR